MATGLFRPAIPRKPNCPDVIPLPPATNQTTAPAETIPLPERQESRQNRRIKPSPLPTTQRSCFGRYRNIRSRHIRTTALWPILHPPELSRPAAPRPVKHPLRPVLPQRKAVVYPDRPPANQHHTSRLIRQKQLRPFPVPTENHKRRQPVASSRILHPYAALEHPDTGILHHTERIPRRRQTAMSIPLPTDPSIGSTGNRTRSHQPGQHHNRQPTRFHLHPPFMSFLHTPEHILPPEKPRTPGRTIASRLWTSYRTPPPEHAIITTWKSDKSTCANSTTSSPSPTPRISERPRKTVSPQPSARRHPAPNRPGHHTICNSGNGRPSPSVSERPVTQNPIRS